MSHVIDYAPDAIDQKIRNLNAALRACEFCTTKDGQPALRLRLMAGCVVGEDGLVYRDGKVVLKGNAHYRTWKDDHGGKLVGDWPCPKGMTEAEVGNNAVAVIELTEAAKKEGRCPKAYEVGIIPHADPKTGEVTYSLTHDFYGGGAGLEQYVGHTEIDYGTPSGKSRLGSTGGKVKSAHGNFLMFYQMAAAQLAAEEAGLDIQFAKNEDGTYSAVADTQGVAAQVLQ